MSNKQLRDRKLLSHQRKIWTEAFKASMRIVSIEAAERKAWQAVDICERAGAFADPSFIRQPSDKAYFDYAEAWECLTKFLTVVDNHTLLIEQPGQLSDAMNKFGAGECRLYDFKDAIASLEPSTHSQPKQLESPVPQLAEYQEVWKRLACRIGNCSQSSNDWESKLLKSMNNFALGKIGFNDFQEDLDEIFPEEYD